MNVQKEIVYLSYAKQVDIVRKRDSPGESPAKRVSSVPKEQLIFLSTQQLIHLILCKKKVTITVTFLFTVRKSHLHQSIVNLATNQSNMKVYAIQLHYHVPFVNKPKTKEGTYTGNQLVFPFCLRDTILRSYHKGLGHQGIARTFASVRKQATVN